VSKRARSDRERARKLREVRRRIAEFASQSARTRRKPSPWSRASPNASPTGC